jgi:hypothetical protein
MFRIVSQTSDPSLEPPRLGDLVDRANQSVDRLNRPAAIIAASDQAVTLAAGAIDVVNTLASAFGPLLARFKGFMEVVDQLGDHLAKVRYYIDIFSASLILGPYVYPGTSLCQCRMDCVVLRPQGCFICDHRHLDYHSLSAPFQAALSQNIRDVAINDLAEAMSDTYAFLCEADQIKQFKSQANILIVMAKQTEECAYFIHGYAEKKSFCPSFCLLPVSRPLTLFFS